MAEENKNTEKVECPMCKRLETKSFIDRDGHCIFCDIRLSNERDRKWDSENAVKEGKGSSEEDAICPYCGEYQGDSWEYDDELDEVLCNNCDKRFGFKKEISVTYKTWKLEEKEEA